MILKVPELSLVLLIGPSGSGKSTFARKHFKPTEVISSDFCRGLVADDENDQAATPVAFDVLHYIAGKRLAAGRLTVIDATNVQEESRAPLVALAREYNVLPVAIVFNIPERVCLDRNKARPDRDFGMRVIAAQRQQMRRSIGRLEKVGFRFVHVFHAVEDVDAATVERVPLWNNLKQEHGPFDIIGDVHGCFDELCELLKKLGYEIRSDEAAAWGARHVAMPPEGRKAIFLGDLVDRGPRIPDVLDLVMQMVESGKAFCVPGNHDVKLVRKLKGRDVQIKHGLAESLAQLEACPDEFRMKATKFLDELVSHYVLDDGKLVVAHAGMKADYQGRGSGRVRDFALFGETLGETDEYGLPMRFDWASEYRGSALVVYGHTPVPDPEWLNRTINIDTGCVFGGKLSALRYPEREIVAVDAKAVYFQPVKPFLAEERAVPDLTAQQQNDDILDIDDVIGKRIISTRLAHTVTIRESHAIAALEVMSRFAINPKWLIYLPPTMSPSETSALPGFLEYPAEAFAYFRHEGVSEVICEEKHMGSRAVIIVCQDEEVARKRFGVVDEGIGACFTRTGRRFIENESQQAEVLGRIRDAVGKAGLWEELGTGWLCLDAEIMPWSAKAQELLRQQYAAVGSAAHAGLTETVKAMEVASGRLPELMPLLEEYRQRLICADAFVKAYRHYCWPVNSVNDLKIAPFHLLASEGKVHMDRDHVWHMEMASRICSGDPAILLATPFRKVETTSEESQKSGCDWWQELTSPGGEGMVIKPMSFIAQGRRGLVQPALKCRGPEYLRIIYGPEYLIPGNLERLRHRGLSVKRALAVREFALGLEGLERFVRREPLRRVHECVFGVLALESEPVDPRL